MRYLREKDDNCLLLCKIQASIFERASTEGIPSAYFAKVYASSAHCLMMDDLSWLDTNIDEITIFNQVKKHVTMRRGTIYPKEVMFWIGYLLREWSYRYYVNTAYILKIAPMSLLADVYPTYHGLDVNKAIALIAESRGIDLQEDTEARVQRIIRQINK